MAKGKKSREVDLERLGKLIEEGMSKPSLLSTMELSTEEEKQQLGQRLMDEKLKAMAPEDGKPRPCPRCGAATKVRAKQVSRTFKSLSGTHSFSRHYYYCGNCKHGFCPRDEELGLAPDAEVSDEVAKRMSDFALNDTFEMCESRWPLHYPFTTASANLFRLVATRLGKTMEACDELVLESAAKPPTAEAVETLYVENDGAMVSMQKGEWREVKSAIIFSAEKNLRGTETKRGQISDARYVSVLGTQEEFKKALTPALKVANAMKVATVIWLADGAKGNWHLARQLCPKAIQILDWYHAMEHAGDCAKVLFGEGHECIGLFRQRVGDLLCSNKIKECLRELLDCLEFATSNEELKAINDLVRYYRANQQRMQYSQYLARGWLIGSGAIESAHRHVIHSRMKKAGQHWGEPGGRRMARMRATYKTAGPERFFRAVHWARRESSLITPRAKSLKLRASNR